MPGPHFRVPRTLLLAAASATTAALLTAAPRPALKEVIVVYKQHFDIGYTDLARNVLRYYRTGMIDKALDIVDRSSDLPAEQRFVWTLPGWPMAQILWDGQEPERRRRVLDAYRQGRLAVHALPFTTHTESLELEDLVRGMGYSSRLARQQSHELPRDAKMTDVPSHSWVVPTLLVHAGVKFLHLGCNPASSSPDVPRLFWWEGPDGSRLLTMYSQGEYGSSLVPPKDWQFDTWLALIHTGDNQGPPTPGDIEKLRREAIEKLPGVKVRMGRLSDFYDALIGRESDIPVIRKDMPDTWIYGPMSMPQANKRARIWRSHLAGLEALNTLRAGWGVAAPVRPDISAAYEKSLLFGEHTWGYDSKRFGERLFGDEWREAYLSGKYDRMDESFDEHGSYSESLQKIVEPDIAVNMSALAGAVGVEGPRIVVFNPLPWSRSASVTMAVNGQEPAALKDATSGETVPVDVDGSELRFLAREVPSMGYRTYVPVTRPAHQDGDLNSDESGRVIENEFFRVTLHPERGAIKSIVDKKSGRELVDSGGEYGFGQFLLERYSRHDVEDYANAYLSSRMYSWAIPDMARGNMPPSEHEVSLPGPMKLELHRGATFLRAEMSAPPGAGVPFGTGLSVTLQPGEPFVEVSWSVEGKPKDPWPEAGWVSMPWKVTEPQFRLARLGAIIDPVTDLVRGSNHAMHFLNGGLAVIDGSGAGVGLAPLDSPVVSLDRRGGYQYWKEFVPRKAVVWMNLFNNLFGTNFQQWVGGSWTSRVRIWTVDHYEASASLFTPGEEARSPLEAAYFDGPAGKLPPDRAGIRLSREGVKVTALGPNPDGDGLVLRLWEQAGRDGECRVWLPAEWKVDSVQPCDLRGRTQGRPIPVRDGSFALPLTHNAPVSLLLDMK